MIPDLSTLRARRRRLLVEGPMLLASSVLLAAVDLERVSALPLVAMLALLGVASLPYCRRFADVIGSPCPRCGALFFVSWPRLLVSFPYLHASCAHCGSRLAARPAARSRISPNRLRGSSATTRSGSA